MDKKKISKESICLLALTILILLLHALRIFNDSISGDEGYSIMLIKMNIPEMLRATAGDVHPPLYYLMYQFFSILGGYSAIAGRVFSYLAIVIAAVLANTYLRKRFGVLVAAIFFLLLTFTSNATEMVIEIRMYTWSMLFVTLTALFAYELMREKKRYQWGGLLIFGLAAAYTHYYALIMVAFIYLFLFVVLIYQDRKNILPCILCALTASLVYFPWLLVLLKQFGTVSADYWITEVDMKECIRYVFGSNRFGKLLRALLVASGLIYLFTQDGLVLTHNLKEKEKVFLRFDWKKNKTLDADRLLVLLCGITAIGTIAVGVCVSYLIRPLYVVRYLYSAMGLVSLAFGIAFTRCSKKKIYAYLLIGGVFLFGFKPFFADYRRENAYQTEETKAFFAENVKSEDPILTNDQMLSWTLFDYYFTDNQTSHLAYYDLLTEDYTTAWYLNTGKKLDPRIPEYEEKGLKVTHVMDSGLGRYPYSLYRIEK